jgi:hypothetical protein
MPSSRVSTLSHPPVKRTPAGIRQPNPVVFGIATRPEHLHSSATTVPGGCVPYVIVPHDEPWLQSECAGQPDDRPVDVAVAEAGNRARPA